MCKIRLFNIFLRILIIFFPSKHDNTAIFCYDKHSFQLSTKIPIPLYAKEPAMFRLWAKIFKDNRMLKDTVIADDSDDTRTHKIFRALDSVCYEFDLGKPIWLDATVKDFKRHDKTRFTQDNFMEQIEFDYMEIHVIEED